MKYIDKSGNRESADKIIDELLSNAWSDDEGKYLGADYNNGLREQKYKEPFIDIIISEQSNLCCYCMEIISKNNITLEHIIPDNIHSSDSDLTRYFKVSELANYVIHKDDFVRTTKQIPPPKYPHDIAYANLIASCNSNTHCNHYRGDNFVFPFVYDAEIEDKVSYDEAGRIACEEYKDDFYELGLSKEYLTLVRRVWKLLAEKITSIKSITKEEFEYEVYGLIDDYEPKSKFIKILTDLSFEKTLPYNWFYHYYKQADDDNE